MTKIIVLLAVLASTGCAGAANDFNGGAAYAGSGGTAAFAAPEHIATVREAPQREAVTHGHVSHRDSEFVVCAQCRH